MSIIGIDLGTTNSVLAIYKDGAPQTVKIDEAKLLPSVVHLGDDGFVVGKTAKNLLILEPEKTIASVKRKMGQDITLPIGDREMRPEEISAVILRKIKEVAARELGVAADSEIRAVITVPAYFTEEQRTATRQAAENAGLKPERIINEPTAAALAFGMSNLDQALYAVYDLGGGTFDISVIESDNGLVEVLSTTGNNQLGGDDFDTALADYMWEDFKQKNKLKSLEADRRTRAKLLQAAENAKIALSQEKEHKIEDSFFLTHKDKSYHLELSITQEKFEEIIRAKIEETVMLLEDAVRDSKMKMTDLDGILLVGGSSRIPLVTELIEEKTGILPQLTDLPDEAVAHGAAVQGAIIDGIDVKTILVDITPYSLGIGVMDEIAEISLFRAMQAEDFDEEKDRDKNLGVGVLIGKNTALPAKNSDTFYGIRPHQKRFELKVYQGEADRAGDNREIGTCLLEVTDPPESTEIYVTFKLDINGILELEAYETTTKEEIKATFKSSRGQKISADKVVENKPRESDEAIVLADTATADNMLIERAEKALKSKDIDEEDRTELEEALGLYQRQHLNGEDEAAEETKGEILDLLYYLEQ